VITKRHTLTFRNGEVGVLNELEGGFYACPICGTPSDEPLYMPNDGELGPKDEVSTPDFGEVCPGCRVEFGVEEGVPPYAPISAMAQQHARLRIKWLNRVGWTPEALQQLREHLGISEEQVRHEADAIKNQDAQ
jgi:hypothetical protein